MKLYDAYDPFARVYNQHWGFFATKAYPILEHLVLEKLSPGCAVLDLCCGTGQLAAELSRRGYRTTGLDGSAEMIEIARKNAPDVDFVVQDARNIALTRKFAAALSTFDSLNHVMLGRTGTGVSKCIQRSGWRRLLRVRPQHGRRLPVQMVWFVRVRGGGPRLRGSIIT